MHNNIYVRIYVPTTWRIKLADPMDHLSGNAASSTGTVSEACATVYKFRTSRSIVTPQLDRLMHANVEPTQLATLVINHFL